MSGPVLWSVDPDPREGLLSLIVGTAAKNFLPSAHVLIQQVGAPHAHNPMVALNPDLDTGRLAWILRQPEPEIVRRHHGTADVKGFVRSFGCTVRADEIGFRTRRFAPSAIGDAPVGRALWSLKTVPCCNEQWEYLVDACACGMIQRWQSADKLDRCDACNAKLAAAAREPVDVALRDGLGFLIGLLDPDPVSRAAARAQLPDGLAAIDGGMVLELALTLMPLAPGGYRPTRGSQPKAGAEQIAYATALAWTADILRGWPGTFVSAIEGEVAHLSRSCRNPRYTGIADYLPAMSNPNIPQTIRDTVLQALAPITSESGTTPADQVGMKASQNLLGVELGVFSQARRQGLLRTRVSLRAGRFFPALDRAEMEHIRDVKDNRISAEMAANQLDLPCYAIALLDDVERIATEPHPFVRAYYGAPQLHRGEFARFTTSLSDKAIGLFVTDADLADVLRDVISDPVSLHRVARAMGGGFKPWGGVMDRLLDGSVAFAMTAPRISRIWISSRDAEDLLALPSSTTQSSSLPSTCSQRDALEILNLPIRNAGLLRKLARADDRWEMKWDEVLQVANDRITLTEMCARTGIQSKTLLMKLGPLNLRSDDFGWWRDEALAALEHIYSSRRFH